MKINLIIDTKNKDKIVYRSGNKSFSLDSNSFLNYVYRIGKNLNEEDILPVILPKNCVWIKQLKDLKIYRIEIKSFEDYVVSSAGNQKRTYKVKWPNMFADVTVAKNNDLEEVILYDSKLKPINMPNIFGGSICFGDYEDTVKDIVKLENNVKLLLQVQFNGSYFTPDKEDDSFFAKWEKTTLHEAMKKDKGDN